MTRKLAVPFICNDTGLSGDWYPAVRAPWNGGCVRLHSPHHNEGDSDANTYGPIPMSRFISP